MAGQIRVSPEVMRQRSGQYRNEAQNVNGVISSMDNLLSMLQSEWEGDASQSYAQRYAELKPGFQKAEELIQDIALALDKAAQQLEETDAQLASGFRG